MYHFPGIETFLKDAGFYNNTPQPPHPALYNLEYTREQKMSHENKSSEAYDCIGGEMWAVLSAAFQWLNPPAAA